MTHIPDPGEDFDGCIKALYEQAAKEIEGMTDEEQNEHFLLRSVEHLIKMYDLDAPRILIKMAHQGANKHLRRLRERSRAARAKARRDRPGSPMLRPS